MARTIKSAVGILWRVHARLCAIDSPVFIRELRTRIRGGRAFAAMGIYLVLLSAFAVCYLMWRAASAYTQMSGVGISQTSASQRYYLYSHMGHDIFVGLALAQLAMAVLFAPGLTANAISSEWERRSGELLFLTTMPTRSIVLGKYFASLGYILLLLFCSLPIMGVCFLLGGVSPVEVALAFLIIFVTALFFGALGLLASALVKRSSIATGLAYGMMVVLAVGLPLAAVNAFALVLFGGLTLAAVVTLAAQRIWPRLREVTQEARAVYIAIFGLSYCAVALLLYEPGYNVIAEWLQAGGHYAHPARVLADLFSSPQAAQYYAGMGRGAAPSVVSPLLVFGGMALCGTLGALLGAAGLVRQMRAPQPDSEETVARLYEEYRLSQGTTTQMRKA